ncbi:hypothetical protein [Zunongwangia sp. HGR-M22]|uniref:hypothetical protein n=1 Tax=Zunongwangia sp. HGR-M22 TaxID=3015168 RepID=UPI0022DD570D|nr:hypothetical protein [Zunongwangia sp. HGR-M22]WBL25743.1 hypothetical protein PBT91_00275 [Zunongwangia sp. HGR-M22]
MFNYNPIKMKTIKNLLGLAFFISIIYSCEPEELPNSINDKHEDVTAGTGDQADEVIDRKDGEEESEDDGSN